MKGRRFFSTLNKDNGRENGEAKMRKVTYCEALALIACNCPALGEPSRESERIVWRFDIKRFVSL